MGTRPIYFYTVLSKSNGLCLSLIIKKLISNEDFESKKNSPFIVFKGQMKIFRREIGVNLKHVWLHCVLMKSKTLLCPKQTEANNKI